jgi:hypothetical protein
MQHIYFYLPHHRRPSVEIPENVPRGYVDELSFSFWNSSLAWNLQTYLRLRELNHSVSLVETVPTEGIVVAHRGDLPFSVRPTERLLFATTIGDAGYHPYAQVQIIQNPHHLESWNNTYLMHHWTQPGLVPRARNRGLTFKNIAYFGHPDQLADKLHSAQWENFLQARGLNWIPVHSDPNRQCDYSDIDLVVAIRSFDDRSYHHKPATKLHNAWLAGVPAVLGPESAYRKERMDELDYLEARSYDDLRHYIEALNENASLRSKLLQRSRKRGSQIDPEAKAEEWWRLLTGPVQNAYEQWIEKSNIQRSFYFMRRWLRVKQLSLSERVGLS